MRWERVGEEEAVLVLWISALAAAKSTGVGPPDPAQAPSRFLLRHLLGSEGDSGPQKQWGLLSLAGGVGVSVPLAGAPLPQAMNLSVHSKCQERGFQSA